MGKTREVCELFKRSEGGEIIVTKYERGDTFHNELKIEIGGIAELRIDNIRFNVKVQEQIGEDVWAGRVLEIIKYANKEILLEYIGINLEEKVVFRKDQVCGWNGPLENKEQ